jgi:hypothetical protein
MSYPFDDSADIMTEGKFAVDVLYYELGMTDPNATEVPIRGLFDDESRNAERGDSQVERTMPTLCVRKAVCPNASNRDKMIINDTNYQVKNVLPDGTGLLDLELKVIL